MPRGKGATRLSVRRFRALSSGHSASYRAFAKPELLRLPTKLLPKTPEPALVDHLVELLPIRVEFEAPLADLALLDLNVHRGQVAAEDQHADAIRHALESPHQFPGIGHWGHLGPGGTPRAERWAW